MAITTAFLSALDYVAERSTPMYETVLTDARGVAIVAAQITTLTLTLYDLMSPTFPIVNLVDHTNIKNADRGTIDAAGKLTIQFQQADMQILDVTRPYEWRRALIEVTYGSGGALAQRHQVDFVVENLNRVP